MINQTFRNIHALIQIAILLSDNNGFCGTMSRHMLIYTNTIVSSKDATKSTIQGVIWKYI